MANINGMTTDKLVANDPTAVSRSIEGLIERYYNFAQNVEYWAKCHRYDTAAELAFKAEELEAVLNSYFGIYPNDWSYCDEDGRWHKNC